MPDKFYDASEFLNNLGQHEHQVLVDRIIWEFDENERSGTVLDMHLLQAIGHKIKRRGGWKLQKKVLEEVRLETSPAKARVVEFHWEDSAEQYLEQAGLKCRVCSKSVNDYRYVFEHLRYGKTLGCQCSMR